MQMQNFYTDSANFTDSTVTLNGEEHHHATRSCRVRIGELIGVTDCCGKRVEARIESIDSRTLTAVIEHDLSGVGEPDVEVTVALALINPARFEDAVEKCTELGVRRFLPLAAQRSTVKPSRIKIERLEKIAREAAKQSGRSLAPEIGNLITVEELAVRASAPMLVAVKEAAWDIDEALRHIETKAGLTLIIGPEGDFTDDELEVMKTGGALFFSLGGLTLRSETAAITATARIIHLLRK